MAKRSVLQFTTGPAGCGKTYRRCAHFLVNDFLPKEEGVHYSNFPIKIDPLCEFVHKQTGKDLKGLKSRIHLIPKKEIDAWMIGDRGPWSYFADVDINDSHIAIDEIHNFCGKGTAKPIRKRWITWLGEIRHRGATIEFISQSHHKVADEIKQEAEVQFKIINMESERDPFFSIQMSYWYELKAKFITGKYQVTLKEIEEVREGSFWKKKEVKAFLRDEIYYPFFDSYSEPFKGGVKGKAKLQEYQKRNYFSLVWWFFKENPIRISTRVGILVFMTWFVYFGGGSSMFNFMGAYMRGMVDSHEASQASEKPVKSNKDVVFIDADYNLVDSPVVQADSAVVDFGQGKVLVDVNRPNLKSKQVKPIRQINIINMEKKIVKLKEQVVALKERNRELVNELGWGSVIVLLDKDEITLANGFQYAMGEYVDWGLLKGKQLIAIDWRRRSAKFHDGTIARMGHQVDITKLLSDDDPGVRLPVGKTK